MKNHTISQRLTFGLILIGVAISSGSIITLRLITMLLNQPQILFWQSGKIWLGFVALAFVGGLAFIGIYLYKNVIQHDVIEPLAALTTLVPEIYELKKTEEILRQSEAGFREIYTCCYRSAMTVQGLVKKFRRACSSLFLRPKNPAKEPASDSLLFMELCGKTAVEYLWRATLTRAQPANSIYPA